MTLLERIALCGLHRLDPERAHGVSIRALAAGLVPLGGPVTSDRLRTRLAGLDLPNPVGLAAGYDKNAEVVAPLTRAGFGFVEVGAATPRAQPGNPRPRLFRLNEDRAVINRPAVPVGLNLGANKDSADRAADFVAVLRTCGPYVDFATVNVSSPNTERLRDLQGKAALSGLLAGVLDERARLARHIPIFLKIAPDLSPSELEDVAQVALESGIDGVIATNTTLSRDRLKGRDRTQAGGLSGVPLFNPSTRILARLSRLTQGRLPLIGVGGIASADDAYAKIRAGASAVQLYSALVYQGLSLAGDIARGLDRLLAHDGFATVADAVGTDRERWL